MTDEEFCKIETAISGEEIDKVEQLTYCSFTGRELKEYLEQAFVIYGVSNCKTEPKLGKLETELGKLQGVHGEIVKYFDVHSGCDSFKFKDGAVYRVKLERSFGKATLD